MPPPTILTIKQNFLSAQVRILSQSLTPSRAWRTANAASEDTISDAALDDALFKLNHAGQQHAKRAYPPQATRHVAEQIDQLYWSAGERSVDEEGPEGALNTAADLANGEIIAKLPTAWESDRQPVEAKRYAELVERLQALALRRQEAEARVQRLRQLRGILTPFKTGVQENLVTRDGEVEKELERMRTLLVRVGDRVARLKEAEGEDSGNSSSLFGEGDVSMEDVDVYEKRKVEELLQRFQGSVG